MYQNDVGFKIRYKLFRPPEYTVRKLYYTLHLRCTIFMLISTVCLSKCFALLDITECVTASFMYVCMYVCSMYVYGLSHYADIFCCWHTNSLYMCCVCASCWLHATNNNTICACSFCKVRSLMTATASRVHDLLRHSYRHVRLVPEAG
jgi:hypothetical protein